MEHNANTIYIDVGWSKQHKTLSGLIWNLIEGIFFARIFPIILTLYLLIIYYKANDEEHFNWTLGIFTVSSICILILYCLMSYQDNFSTEKFKFSNSMKCIKHAIVSYFCLSLRSTYFHWKAYTSKEKELKLEYTDRAVQVDADDGMICLVGNFIGCGPQEILQLSILLPNVRMLNYFNFQHIYIIFTIILLNWSLVNFHKKNRQCQMDKYNLNFFRAMIIFTFNILLIGVRIMCIALLFTVRFDLTLIICISHIFGAILWLYFIEGPVFSDEENPLLFDVIFGLIYLFTFIPVTEQPTRYRYAAYHFINLLENIGYIYFFYLYTNEKERNYLFFDQLCIILAVSFILGISIKLIYYSFFHPSKSQKWIIN